MINNNNKKKKLLRTDRLHLELYSILRHNNASDFYLEMQL